MEWLGYQTSQCISKVDLTKLLMEMLQICVVEASTTAPSKPSINSAHTTQLCRPGFHSRESLFKNRLPHRSHLHFSPQLEKARLRWIKLSLALRRPPPEHEQRRSGIGASQSAPNITETPISPLAHHTTYHLLIRTNMVCIKKNIGQ